MAGRGTKAARWVAVTAALVSASVVAGTAEADSDTFATSSVEGLAGANVPEGLHGVTPDRILDTRSGIGAPKAKVGPRRSVNVQVTGRGGVPSSGVKAVVLNVTATEGTNASYLTVHPTGSQRPVASNLNFWPYENVPNLVIAAVGDGGKVTIYNEHGSVHVIADVMGYYDSDSLIVTYAPRRILDTRDGTGNIVGPTSGTRTVQIAGRGGVPLQGATAVIVNVTATQPSQAQYVTVYPSGQRRPTASNLNLLPGDTRANLAIVQLGEGGAIDYYSSHGNTHLIMDVLGYVSEPPSMLDVADRVAGSTWNRLSERDVAVDGIWRPLSLRASYAGSPTSPVWAEYNIGREWKSLSTVLGFDDNYTASGISVQFRILGDGVELVNKTLTFPQSEVVQLDVTGVLRLRFETALIANTYDSSQHGAVFARPKVSTAATATRNVDYFPMTPVRILDTREGLGSAKRKLRAGETLDLQVLGVGGIPRCCIGAVAVNLTVTEPDRAGYLTGFPSKAKLPPTSNVNFVAGQTIPNFAILPVGPNGRISLYAGASATHVIADVAGIYPGDVDISSRTSKLAEDLDFVARHKPFSAWMQERSDVEVNGTPYYRSIAVCCGPTGGTHWIEYNLSRRWKQLSTTFAYMDSTGLSSSRARFLIIGDGKVLSEREVAFGETFPVNVDVTGVLRIRFELREIDPSVDYEEAVFIDPTLTR